MKTKIELLKIVQSIEINSDDEPFFRFGCNYLFGMKRRGVTDKSEFFNMLKYSEKNVQAVRRYYGISGNNQDESIKRWCRLMQSLRMSLFADLDIDDLRQLFGYCSYEAKIRKEGIRK